MLRIVLSSLFTAALLIALRDLVQNGMWLQLGIACLASCGFGMLFILNAVLTKKET